MNQAESGGCEQLAFLALAGRVFDQVGRVPFAEEDLEGLQLQPPLEQVNLGGFARAVQPFNGHQTAGEIQFGEGFHRSARQS